MAELLLKDVSEETLRRLERRAETHGHSVEAEHRAILEAALGARPAASREGELTAQAMDEAFRDMPWLAELHPDAPNDRDETGREAHTPPEGPDRPAEAVGRG